MTSKFRGLLAAALLGAASPAWAELQITEIMYNPVGNDSIYEWFEVRNTGAAPIDLNGYQVEGLGDLYREVFTRSITNTLDPTTIIGPGEVAVLYDGFFSTGSPFNYSDDTFRSTWGIPSTVPVISIDFAPALGNSGPRSVGLWADNAAVLLDSAPGATVLEDRTITGFANAAASFSYDTTAPWPTGATNISIEWDGVGDRADGASWSLSQVGVRGGRTSNPILDTAGGFLNNPSDFGSPGLVPGGPVASGVVISEIMYNPASSEPAWEWVEIVNNTGAALDFAATPFVFDDLGGANIAAANVSSGVVPAGGVAVLFNGTANNAADVATAWGAAVNFIPVSDWPSLNNVSGTGSESIGLWDSFTDYTGEATPRTFTSAVATVTYQDTANDWPDATGTESIALNDLSADPSLGLNWSVSSFDNGAFNANGVPVSTITIYEGGDVATPGVFEVVDAPGLPGDANGDGNVDLLDLDILGANFGLTTGATLGQGDFNGDGGVDLLDLDILGANFGATTMPAAAVPEPAALALAAFAAAFVARRR